MKILFFGTPEFAASILKQLIEKGVEIVGIVTRPDKPKGRSLKLEAPEVKLLAQSLIPHVPIYQPAKCSTPESIEELRKLNADLFVVVAFGEIISQALLDVPRLGCINVHPSHLPKYRGAAPMQRTLMSGEQETAVCIIRMVRKMDAGDILFKEMVPLDPSITYGELEPKLADISVKGLLQVFEELATGTLNPIQQDESLVTFAAKIAQEDCLIDWAAPGRVIYNKIRALSPQPGAYCFMSIRGQEKRVKILKATFLDVMPDPLPKKQFVVACKEGAIHLDRIQIEGKPAMSMEDFLRGTPVEQILLLAKK